MEHAVENPGRSWRDDLPLAATAAGVAGTGWALAWMAGVDLVVRSAAGTQHVNVVSALVAAVVVTLAAGGMLRVLERRTRGAVRAWTALASVVLVLSLAGPLGAVTPGAGLVLAGLHLLVGGVVILGVRRSRAGRRVA